MKTEFALEFLNCMCENNGLKLLRDNKPIISIKIEGKQYVLIKNGPVNGITYQFFRFEITIATQ